MEIGANIRNTRKEKGLSQVEVSQKAGIAVNSLRLYEAGKRQPNLKILKKIADALGVEVWALADFDTASRILEYEGTAHKIKQDMMDSAPTWEEYKEAKKTKVSDIQMDLVLAEMERDRLNNLQSAFLRLNETGQKKAVENVEDLAKIPEYQKKDEPGQE